MTEVAIDFVSYGTKSSGDRSGAYLFLPNGPAEVCFFNDLLMGNQTWKQGSLGRISTMQCSHWNFQILKKKNGEYSDLYQKFAAHLISRHATENNIENEIP